MKTSTRLQKAHDAAMEKLKQSTEKTPEPAIQPVTLPEPVVEEAPPEVKEEVKPEIPAEPRSMDFRQQYLVLQGKYNKEVRDTSELAKQTQVENARFQAENARLREELASKTTKPDELASLGEDFGEDAISPIRMAVESAVERRVAEATAPLAEALAKVAHAQQAFTESTTANAKQRFMEILDKDIPDWEKVYNSPGYMTFEAGVEPITGLTFKELMDNAANRLDANRVKAILTTYQNKNIPKVPDLREQVVPSGVKGQGVPLPTARIYAKSEVDQIMRDAKVGKKYRGREQELDALLNDVSKAYMEGRVR